MTAPAYMQAPWFDLLRQQCERLSQTAIARELGVSTAAINQVLRGGGLYGSGQASTALIAERVTHTFGRYVCPYLTEEAGGAEVWISAEQCRFYAHRPAPVGQPIAMRHWQACRQCPHAAASAPPQPKPVRHRAPKTKPADSEVNRDAD